VIVTYQKRQAKHGGLEKKQKVWKQAGEPLRGIECIEKVEMKA
jgi:hypothetical protein